MNAPRQYTVKVDDNFHDMDETERYVLGQFDDYATAEAKCRTIVDAFLLDACKPGMSAGDPYTSYTWLGEDPFITPRQPGHGFSA